MARSRKAFGPLFYGTVTVSVALLGSYGGWLGWQSVARAWETRGLVQQFRDPSSRVRWRAAGQLAQLGTDAVPVLLEAMKDPDSNVRLMACRTLPSTDPDAPRAVPALVAVLRDPEPRVRRAAAFDLGMLYQTFLIEERGQGRWTNEILRALRGSLHDDDERVRRVSAESIVFCGANAGPAVAELTEALSDKCGDVRLAAARTLLQVDEDSRGPAIMALKALVSDLSIPLKNTPRETVISELGTFEPDICANTAPNLVRWLADPDSARRVEAVGLFKSIGQAARPVAADVERLLARGDSTSRACAGMALAWIEPGCRDRILPGLFASAKDASFDAHVRAKLFDTIRELAPEFEVELGAMVCESVRQESADQRLVAIGLLGHLIQSEQQLAMPALLEAQDDPDKRIAEAARKVLGELKLTTPKGSNNKTTASR